MANTNKKTVENASYTVERDATLGVYRVARNGQPFRVICQTIIEIRLGILLSDEEVIALATK